MSSESINSVRVAKVLWVISVSQMSALAALADVETSVPLTNAEISELEVAIREGTDYQYWQVYGFRDRDRRDVAIYLVSRPELIANRLCYSARWQIDARSIDEFRANWPDSFDLTENRETLVGLIPRETRYDASDCLSLGLERDYFVLTTPIESSTLIDIVESRYSILERAKLLPTAPKLGESEQLHLLSIGIEPSISADSGTRFSYQLDFEADGAAFVGLSLTVSTRGFSYNVEQVFLVY